MQCTKAGCQSTCDTGVPINTCFLSLFSFFHASIWITLKLYSALSDHSYQTASKGYFLSFLLLHALLSHEHSSFNLSVINPGTRIHYGLGIVCANDLRFPWKNNQNKTPIKHMGTALEQISNAGFTPGAFALC